MTQEHKRLIGVVKEAKNSMSIRVTDRVLVFATNETGLWASDGNLGSKENQIRFLENILKEMKKCIK